MKPLSRNLWLLTALLPGVLAAQDETTEAIQFYDVEIVVFKNIKAPSSKEFVLPVSSPARTDEMLDLSSAVSVAAAGELDYSLLPADEYRLLEQVARLIESPRYELLTHVAWRQPGLERDKAKPIWIKGGRIFGEEYTSIDSRIELLDARPRQLEADGSENSTIEINEENLEAMELQMLENQAALRHGGLYEMEGKITIALARYLHVFTDLVLRRPRLSLDPVLNNPIQDRFLADNAADTRILNNHSLKEHRRMRSKNLHYLDHPEFSLLILITPYDAPAQALPVAEPATAAQG